MKTLQLDLQRYSTYYTDVEKFNVEESTKNL